jgi:hypothetical protein
VPKGRHPRPEMPRTGPRKEERKTPYVICVKCAGVHYRKAWTSHYRWCILRMPACPVCRGAFPCRNDLCPWFRVPPPAVPPHLVPYFQAKDKNDFPELELEALRFLREARLAWG